MAQQTEQTVAPEAPVSVEDQLGAKFERLFFGSDEQSEQPTQGEPEGEEEAKGEPEAEPAEEAKPEEGSDDSVEVEFNGTKYQVPAELKDALMATSDYTKKTTEVSQLRKAVDLQHKEIALFQEQRKFQESVAQDAEQFHMLGAYIEHLKKNTDWPNLDQRKYDEAKRELDMARERHSELEKVLSGKRSEFEGKLKAERDKIRAEIGEHLAKSIPGWSDETRGAIHKFVQEVGYPAAALEGMSALDYSMAYEAMQYRKLKAEAKSVVKNAAPVIKPSARKEMPKDTQDKLNYRKAIKKAGSQKERQKLAEDRIASIFGG